MIGKLKGRIEHLDEESALLDVGGVCYEVWCSRHSLTALPAVGEATALWTELQVREDSMTLFGFATVEEREWYRLLITVQGVGSRVALAILSILRGQELATAIAAGDAKMIQRANGVGAKLAARIVTELKDKVAKVAVGMPMPATSATLPVKGKSPLLQAVDRLSEDATSALVNLGYGQSEAFAAVARVRSEHAEITELGRLIPLVLRELSPVRA